MGLNPRSLIKNIPSRTQQWKAPVEDWVRDVYEKRQRKASRRGQSGTGTAPPDPAREP
jgi:hypothetical protein